MTIIILGGWRLAPPSSWAAAICTAPRVVRPSCAGPLRRRRQPLRFKPLQRAMRQH